MIRQTIRHLSIGLALALGLSSTALAQSSSGNIVGDGLKGETVEIAGTDNGFHRKIEVKEDGKFTIRRVPTGSYFVIRTAADGEAMPGQTIEVKVGSTARVQ